MALFVYIQKVYLSPIGEKFFPNYTELFPEFILTFYNKTEEPKKLPKKEKKELILNSGEDYNHLKNLFHKLESLEEKKNKVVRIVHFGDSIMWGGFVTSKLKENFQKDFGDGGRGLVPIVPSIKRKLLFHNNLTNTEQFISEETEPLGKLKPQLGFLGETYIPVQNSIYLSHSLGVDSKPWKHLEFYVRNTSQQPYFIKTKLFSKEYSFSKTFRLDVTTCYNIPFDLPNVDWFTLNVNNIKVGSFYLDAINVETNFGIAYSPVSRQGIEMNDLLTVPEDNFSCGIKLYSPDLIIFQFGVNESENMYYSKEKIEVYKQKLTKVIQRFKNHLPYSDILLLSPYERIRLNSNGQYVTMSEITNIIQAQKEVSQDLDIAFYNSFLALGGNGHNQILYKKGLMQPDRTHLTRKGGEYYSSVLYNEIYNTYQKFLGHEKLARKLELEKLKKEKNKEIYFNSKAYAYFLLFVFFVSILFMSKPNLKISFLTLVSLYFYATWNFWPTLLIVLSASIDFFCSKWIYKKQTLGQKGTLYLVFSLFLNLSILFFFKYYDFFVSLLNKLVINGEKVEIGMLYLTLPVGISFYTFQSLSYTIDIYRKQLIPEKNFIKFTSYVTFFPQLVAGPIVRAIEFLPRLKDAGQHFIVSSTKFQTGIFIILCGLIKKTGADWLAVRIVDKVYANPEMYSSVETVAALYAYGLQIYGDFSGYTDIAVGSAMLLGFHLTKNFDYPYSSFSITDFWRRWHISLGSWFRDYLYISLGGSRNAVYRNLFITMFLCGLWHGAGIPFIIWGIYHGIFLAMERITGLDKKTKIWYIDFIRQIITLHIVLFGWWIFRTDSYKTFEGMWNVIKNGTTSTLNLDTITIIVIVNSYCYYIFLKHLKAKFQNVWLKTGFIVQAFIVAFVIALLYNLSITKIQPFIYFQF